MISLARVSAFAWLAMAGPAHADTLVCKQGKAVKPGMASADVIARCGPPTSRESRVEELRATNAAGYSFKHGERTVETWLYDRGSQKPPAVLVIAEGKVVSIEFLD